MKQNVFFPVLAVTCALLLTLPAFLLVCGFLLPAQYAGTFLGELSEKCQRLDRTEGPRIILIGGSALAFGVDSRILEEQLPGYTAVNFGLYAALGTPVMLELAAQSVRPGDLVILVPEQDPQTLSRYFNGEAMWQAVDGSFSLLTRVERTHWGQLLGTFPQFAGRKLGFVLRGKEAEGSGVYARDSFNEYGDIDCGLCAANVMVNGYDPNTPIRFSPAIVEEAFLSDLNRFAQRLTDLGAAVWYHFPPMNVLAAAEEENVDEYAEWLQEQLCFPIAGDPNRCIMDGEWFYDTNFHLNSSGKVVFTRQLVRDIKAMLGDSSSTDISLPAMPPFRPSGPVRGDDSHAAWFIASTLGDGVALTGLTQEGALQTELVLPSYWEGRQVLALTDSVFSGNTTVRRIIMQENIRFVEDCAFAGCTSLQEIVLTSPDPSGCLVGRQLLEGTNCVLTVPPQSLSSYKTHYTWSVYGSRIMAAGEAQKTKRMPNRSACAPCGFVEKRLYAG